MADVDSYTASIEIPDDLSERVWEQLAHAPGQSWDDAIEWLVPPAMLDEELVWFRKCSPALYGD